MEDETIDVSQETSPSNVFLPPSVNIHKLTSGESYAHYSPCPPAITCKAASSDALIDPAAESTPCVLGIDEAGRGPVLGPMVYSAFYLPVPLHHPLLAKEHRFDDSKVLTPGVRSGLMRLLCTPDQSLHTSCGWAVKVMSARDISAGMLRPGPGLYNLNSQALDATVEIIRGVVEDRKVNVREVYVDTVGQPAAYQKKLERIFPTMKITVAKKADSLYPCVSAASVCAKVTRDMGLEVCYGEILKTKKFENDSKAENWGSGYPSDSKCVAWLRKDMDPVFGWGSECRQSWGTAKDMIENKGGARVDWPVDEDDDARRLTDYFSATVSGKMDDGDELRNWYGGTPAEIF